MSKCQYSGTMEDFQARLQDPQRGVVVDFTGSYCAPCRQLEPILEELANEFGERIDVLTLDIERYPELAQRYGVRSVPTLVAIHGGQVRAQQVGFSTRRRVRELFLELPLSDR